jgi:hypothetical protein
MIDAGGRTKQGAAPSTKRSCAVARREILDRIQKYVDPFRITEGNT